jgi:hypothetical protein
MNATIGHSVANLSPDQQTWFHHNVNLAIKLRAVPFKGEQLADDCWRGSPLEHDPENIPQQFLQWLPQWPVPGIRGQGICSGAILRNGAVFRGEGIPAKPPKTVEPKPIAPAPALSWGGGWKPLQAQVPLPPAAAPAEPAPPVLDKNEGLIARARAAIAKGADRVGVVKLLRSAGIDAEI